VSAMQRAVPPGEDDEEAGDIPLLRERRLRIQVKPNSRADR
jgi:hypothetical protein